MMITLRNMGCRQYMFGSYQRTILLLLLLPPSLLLVVLLLRPILALMVSQTPSKLMYGSGTSTSSNRKMRRGGMKMCRGSPLRTPTPVNVTTACSKPQVFRFKKKHQCEAANGQQGKQ